LDKAFELDTEPDLFLGLRQAGGEPITPSLFRAGLSGAGAMESRRRSKL